MSDLTRELLEIIRSLERAKKICEDRRLCDFPVVYDDQRIFSLKKTIRKSILLLTDSRGDAIDDVIVLLRRALEE